MASCSSSVGAAFEATHFQGVYGDGRTSFPKRTAIGKAMFVCRVSIDNNSVPGGRPSSSKQFRMPVWPGYYITSIFFPALLSRLRTIEIALWGHNVSYKQAPLVERISPPDSVLHMLFRVPHVHVTFENDPPSENLYRQSTNAGNTALYKRRPPRAYRASERQLHGV